MEQNRNAAAEAAIDALHEDSWDEDLEDEELFESFPPELLARSMSDALERLKNFDPFAI